MPAAEQSIWDKNWDVPQGYSVAQTLERLNLPKEVRATVLVNNNNVDPKFILKEGDVVHILPLMFGG